MSKKLVYDFGVNDIKNSTNTKYKMLWRGMLERCYSKQEMKRKPTYKYNEVDIQWQKLSEFKKWFDIHYIKGYQLDKDLIIPNNRIYGPDTCLFIPMEINQLIKRLNSKGWYLLPSGNYKSKLYINGKYEYYPTVSSEYLANRNYCIGKANYWLDIADAYWKINEKISIGLYRHAESLIGNDWRNLPY